MGIKRVACATVCALCATTAGAGECPDIAKFRSDEVINSYDVHKMTGFWSVGAAVLIDVNLWGRRQFPKPCVDCFLLALDAAGTNRLTWILPRSGRGAKL